MNTVQCNTNTTVFEGEPSVFRHDDLLEWCGQNRIGIQNPRDPHAGPDYPLCRLYHGRAPPVARGPRRSAAKCLPRCFDVWTFSVRLNVMTTKKVVNFWEKSASPQIRKSWLRIEKRAPALRWYWAPEWLIRPCPHADSKPVWLPVLYFLFRRRDLFQWPNSTKIIDP